MVNLQHLEIIIQYFAYSNIYEFIYAIHRYVQNFPIGDFVIYIAWFDKITYRKK